MASPIVNRVLLICTANVCRSPTAEVLLQHETCGKIEVRSAGTHALLGARIDDAMKIRLDNYLGNLILGRANSHTALQLDEDLARWAELVLVMTRDHHAWCIGKYPFLRGRVRQFSLREVEINPSKKGQHIPQFEKMFEDIEDPFKKSAETYDRVFRQLCICGKEWAKSILNN